MKSKFIILGVVLILGILFGAAYFFLLRHRPSPTVDSNPSPTPVKEVTDVPLEERPFLQLIPRADGKQLTLRLSRFGDAKTLEYELTYQSQGIPRGVIGSAELSGQTEISKDLLLGSCSRNVCRYDEGVDRGNIILRLRGQDGVRKFDSNFILKKGESELASNDGQFTFSGKLGTAYYVLLPTIGLPGPIDGEVAAGPYGIFASDGSSVKNGRVTFSTDGQIHFWDGKSWAEISSGNVDRLGIYTLLIP